MRVFTAIAFASLLLIPLPESCAKSERPHN